MNKIKRIKTYILIIILGFALFGGVLLLAWFFQETEHELDFITGDFEIVFDIYLMVEGSRHEATPYYRCDADNPKEVLTLDGANPDMVNYVGNLRVDLLIKAPLPARLRFKVMDEWLLIRDYTSLENNIISVIAHERNDGGSIDPLFPFHYPEAFSYLIDESTSYVYYDALIARGASLVIPLIVGATPYPIRVTTAYTESCQVNFEIYAELVQANRFPELWRISPDFFK